MVKSAILLVGGMGTRMQPLTFDTPKPMLQLLGKPITEHQILKAKAAGITEIVLATSFLADIFTPYFGDGEKFGIKISYAVEESALGTGGAIRNAASLLSGDGAVLIFNGDVLSEHSLTDQMTRHEESSAEITLHLTEVVDARPFGVVEMRGDRIVTFNEKMENPPTKIINAGCYIFNRSVIDEIPASAVVSVEREVFPSLLARGANLVGYLEKSYWLDIGNPGALLQATRQLVEASGHPSAHAKGSLIDPTAIVDQGSYIGAGAVVGAGARLHQCVVGDGAVIAENVELTRTFIAAGAQIGANVVAIDEFIGYSSHYA